MLQASNGFADAPQFDVNANKKIIESTPDENTINGYEPGQATEMLTNSVLNLKIENDARLDFKAHAGKILTGMLESRLNNEKNLQNGHAHKIASNQLSNSKINDKNNKNLHDTNGNSIINNGKPTFLRSFNAATIVPKLSPNSDAANKIAMPLIIPTSPCSDFPPPPSPSELNDHTMCDFPNENHKQVSIIGQTKFNEHDHEKPLNHSNNTIDGFSAKTSPIQSQFQHQPQINDHPTNNQQPYANGHTDNVVFRNKNTKPELTTHARDRRSYIEKDNVNSNRFLNNNNNLITSYATEIATGLQDGKHPVCSVCHIKITR